MPIRHDKQTPLEVYTHMGVDPARPHHLNKKIYLTNLVSLGLACVALPYTIFFGWVSMPFLSGFVFLVFSLFALVPLLNHSGWFNLSRIMLLIVANGGLYVFAGLIGKSAGVEQLFFAIIGLPALVFSWRNERWPLFGGFGITILAYSAFSSLGGYTNPAAAALSGERLDLLNTGMTLTTAVIILLSLIQLKMSSARLEEHLERSESRAHSLLDAMAEGVVMHDRSGKIISCNPAAEKILRLTKDELLGYHSIDKNWVAVHESGDPYKPEERPSRIALRTGKPCRNVIMGICHENGETAWLSVNSQPVFDDPKNPDKPSAVVSSFIDISEQRQQETIIMEHSMQDSLTGLANRVLLMSNLKLEIAHARRANTQVAVFFLDLDRFKLVNDSYGHAAGDWLLKEAARRLKECLRESDTIARRSGDEFIIVLPDLEDRMAPKSIAAKIAESLTQPFTYQGKDLHISCSIGIAMYPRDGEGPEELLRNADNAMYSAKRKGRNNYQFFTESLHYQIQTRRKIEEELHTALERDALEVYFQPRLDLQTGKVRGGEALLRWFKEDGSAVSPAEFIPVAEETGLIVPIGEMVLNKTGAFYQRLAESGLGHLVMSVNFSPRQFEQIRLVKQINSTLEKAGLPPHNLEMEITEGVIMSDPLAVTTTLQSLRETGIQISVDDFGQGYSSLAYLKNLPVDILKIDRMFIKGIPHNQDDLAIVHAVIALGRRLGLQVVAEGVETLEQAAKLKEMDCHEVQGFAYSKPLRQSAFLEYVLSNSAQPTTSKSVGL